MELTVGIPVFNEEERVLRAIASVVNQSWQGTYEILIVDDGSNDRTVEVILAAQKRFPAIRLVRHERNMGRPHARSTLATEARGKWFAMLDADDEWFPNKILRQFEVIENLQRKGETTDNLMICGNILHIDLDKGGERVKNFYEGYGKAGYDVTRVLKGDNTPISQLALMRTDFLRKVGHFDPNLRRAQDWDFLIRFFLAGGRMEFLPNPPLAIFHFRRAGRNPDVVEQCMFRVIEKHRDAYDRYGVDPNGVKSSIQAYITSFRETPAG